MTEASAPALVPTLSLFSVVVFGLAYMAPAIVLAIFGIIALSSGGAAPSSFVLATVAMFLTALSYAKMSKAFPNGRQDY